MVSFTDEIIVYGERRNAEIFPSAQDLARISSNDPYWV